MAEPMEVEVEHDIQVEAKILDIFSTAWQHCWPPGRWTAGVEQLASDVNISSDELGEMVCRVLMENGTAAPKPSQIITSYLRHGLANGLISVQHLAGFLVRGDGFCTTTLPAHFQTALELLQDFIFSLQTNLAEFSSDRRKKSIDRADMLNKVLCVLFNLHASCAADEQEIAMLCGRIATSILRDARCHTLLAAIVSCEEERIVSLQNAWNSAKTANLFTPPEILELERRVAACVVEKGWARSLQPACSCPGISTAVRCLALQELSQTNGQLDHNAIVWEVISVFHRVSLEEVCCQLWTTGLAELVARPADAAIYMSFLVIRVPNFLILLRDSHGVQCTSESMGEHVLRHINASKSIITAAETILGGISISDALIVSLANVGLMESNSASTLDQVIPNLAKSKRCSLLTRIREIQLDPVASISWEDVIASIDAVLSDSVTLEWLGSALNAGFELQNLIDPLKRIISVVGSADNTEVTIDVYNKAFLLVHWLASCYVCHPLASGEPVPQQSNTMAAEIVESITKNSFDPVKTAIKYKATSFEVTGSQVAEQLVAAIKVGSLNLASAEFANALVSLAKCLPVTYFGTVHWLCEKLDGSVSMTSDTNQSIFRLLYQMVAIFKSDKASPWLPNMDLLARILQKKTIHILRRHFQIIPQIEIKENITSSVQKFYKVDMSHQQPEEAFHSLMCGSVPLGGRQLGHFVDEARRNGAKWFCNLACTEIVTGMHLVDRLEKIRDTVCVVLMQCGGPLGTISNDLISEIRNALESVVSTRQATILAELAFYVTCMSVRDCQIPNDNQMTEKLEPLGNALSSLMKLASDVLKSDVQVASIFAITLAELGTSRLGGPGLIPQKLRTDSLTLEIEKYGYRLRMLGHGRLARGLFDLTSRGGCESCAMFYCLPSIPSSIISNGMVLSKQ